MRWPFGGTARDEAADAAAASDAQRDRGRRTGEILRQARIAHGLGVSDVERDIRINRLYLEALEAARFEVLPAPVYARGFMRAYAKYLGLDADEAALAIPAALPRPAGLEPLPGLRRSMPVTMPEVNAPLAVAAVVFVLIAVAALLAVPRFFGGDGAATPVISTATGTAAGAPSSGALEATQVPELEGMTRETATGALRSAGLASLVLESAGATPAGRVVRQSPIAGAPARRGDVVTMFVSTGAGGTATAAAGR